MTSDTSSPKNPMPDPREDKSALPAATKKRLGFMAGRVKVPDDIKAFAREEIEDMFYGEPD